MTLSQAFVTQFTRPYGYLRHRIDTHTHTHTSYGDTHKADTRRTHIKSIVGVERALTRCSVDATAKVLCHYETKATE